VMGSDLSGANLSGAKLKDVGWYGTICPNGRKTTTHCGKHG
jgi:uncharacterized protein YjbI with pentapeptide repeats